MAKILIIEDEEVLSDAFRIILERDGHSIQVARNGEEGLLLMQKYKPELTLLDLLMPVMGGLEFLEKVFLDESNQHAKIVVLSNLHETKTIDKTITLGAKEYVVKSQMTPSTLSKLVAKWLS